MRTKTTVDEPKASETPLVVAGIKHQPSRCWVTLGSVDALIKRPRNRRCLRPLQPNGKPILNFGLVLTPLGKGF